MRRRRADKQNEQIIELNQVLEPYQEMEWTDDGDDAKTYTADAAALSQAYAPNDSGFYDEEYSPEHEAADTENHFRLAIGMFDLISIIVGIAVVLVLVGMLMTLFNWLRNDILHSALLLQSGLR